MSTFQGKLARYLIDSKKLQTGGIRQRQLCFFVKRGYSDHMKRLKGRA